MNASITLNKLARFFRWEGDVMRCTACERTQHVSWGADAHNFVHRSGCPHEGSAPSRPWRALTDAYHAASGTVPVKPAA